MRRYAGQNEVRFKVTDKQAEDGAWIMYARTIDLQSYTQI
jgi:hypothetical protein